MRTWIKASLLIVLALGLSWGGAIWFWRATNRLPSTPDLVLYLVALPLGLLLALWLGRKLMAMLAAAPAAAPAAGLDNDAAPPQPAPPAASLALLAAALRTPHGTSADDLTAAILDNQARPELDQELVDDYGFPVMAARSADADDPALQEEITEWFGLNDVDDIALQREQWRALTMATGVVSELAGAAASELIPAEGVSPMLHLLPLLPPEWTGEERRAAGLWLRHVVSQAGWPLARIALAAQLPTDARATSPSAVLGRLAHQATLSGEPLVGLVVAAASNLSETCLTRWEDNATLFKASRPQGLIPGEGAAGLLLTDLPQIRAISGATYAILGLEADARRAHSADETKKAEAVLLGVMTEKVFASGAAPADTVGMLVADTGHRTSRVLELMELLSATLPHLDVDTELLRTGSACGSCGAVPFMTALALARHQAIALAAPVLCISNEDPYRRSAVLVQPAAALS